RGIKSTVTIQAREIDPGFAWQRGYYVHIVNTKKDYKRIVKYIEENPSKYKRRQAGVSIHFPDK
ncbi:MAG TPA: hypothetical protein VJ877_00725, partial [Bacteroidales bacterium]|nr:hypothetical protein [Bacteroidales bacterium]